MIKDMIAAVYHNLHQSFIFIFSLEKCNREESCTYWTFSTFRTKIKDQRSRKIKIIRQSYCNLYKYCNLKKTERNITSTSGPKGCPHTGEINNHHFFLQIFFRKLPKGMDILSYHWQVLQILQRINEMDRCTFFLYKDLP